MRRTRGALLWLATICLLLVGCTAPPGSAPGGREGQGAQPPVGPKRIVAAILSDPPSLYPALNPSSIRGSEVIAELANSGLSVLDNQGSLRPQLAEAVPSIDNDLWRINPDGGAETTWRLREGIRWHDGTAFSSSDLLFTVTLFRDKDVAMSNDRGFDFIASVEAPDPRTVTVKWKDPYVQADRLFSRALGFPVARHLIEPSYQRDKATLLALPYWTTGYIGTGPFKLKDWAPGSQMVFTANDGYALGRPKVDEIEIKFIPDPNTILAAVLAGGVNLTLGKTISVEQAMEAQNVWKEGRVDQAPGNAVVMRVQFLYANPPIVLQLPFRRALEHAIDRHQLADGLVGGGLAPSAETSLFSPLEPPEYLPARDQVIRYPFDPRRAAELIGGLGYSRAADGAFRDPAGQGISVGIRTNVEDLNQKATLAVADYWKQVGVQGVPEFFPQSAANDQEYRAKFPAFELLRGLNLDGVDSFQSSYRKTAENNWKGANGGYGNPEYDALIDRYLVTIPTEARVQILGQVLRHVSDQVIVIVLFWDVEPLLIGNHIQNITARHRSSSHAWNATDWDLTN